MHSKTNIHVVHNVVVAFFVEVEVIVVRLRLVVLVVGELRHESLLEMLKWVKSDSSVAYSR